MSVRASALVSTHDARHQIVLSRPTDADAPTLEHEVHLGAGVRLAVDLARPNTWRRLSITDWSAAAAPIVAAVAGERASQELGAMGSQPDRTDGTRLDIDATHAGPWLRVAVVHALDRWLHMPLEQALLQAETGVAMLRAAHGLPTDADVRGAVIDEALGWARRAANGFTRFLQDLGAARRPAPPALHRSVEDLVEGYRELRAQLDEPDLDLDAVLTDWQAVARRSPAAGGRIHSGWPSPEAAVHATSARLATWVASMIDPRHVRARVLGLGDQARSAEISLAKAYTHGQEAVRVRVAAFERRIDPEIAQRLMARLVNRRSGSPLGFARLVVHAGSSDTKSRPPFFEATMPLAGPLEDVRADVYDALLSTHLGADDTEEDLLRVRRAVLLLRQRRSRAARSRLESPDDRRPTAAGSTAGPDRPLLAELAAAYEDQAA